MPKTWARQRFRLTQSGRFGSPASGRPTTFPPVRLAMKPRICHALGASLDLSTCLTLLRPQSVVPRFRFDLARPIFPCEADTCPIPPLRDRGGRRSWAVRCTPSINASAQLCSVSGVLVSLSVFSSNARPPFSRAGGRRWAGRYKVTSISPKPSASCFVGFP